mmetsp:Transcript_50405/g.99629  ORF Transcript_50405/g.99629 Transcript_50405/m.99629 type:complete len:374 (-) Transcript_50405:37-1158(-)
MKAWWGRQRRRRRRREGRGHGKAGRLPKRGRRSLLLLPQDFPPPKLVPQTQRLEVRRIQHRTRRRRRVHPLFQLSDLRPFQPLHRHAAARADAANASVADSSSSSAFAFASTSASFAAAACTAAVVGGGVCVCVCNFGRSPHGRHGRGLCRRFRRRAHLGLLLLLLLLLPPLLFLQLLELFLLPLLLGLLLGLSQRDLLPRHQPRRVTQEHLQQLLHRRVRRFQHRFRLLGQLLRLQRPLVFFHVFLPPALLPAATALASVQKEVFEPFTATSVPALAETTTTAAVIPRHQRRRAGKLAAHAETAAAARDWLVGANSFLSRLSILVSILIVATTILLLLLLLVVIAFTLTAITAIAFTVITVVVIIFLRHILL